MKRPLLLSIFILSIIYFGCSSTPETVNVVSKKYSPTFDAKANEFRIDFAKRMFKFKIPDGSKIDDFLINTNTKTIVIKFNRNFGFRPFRENSVKEIYSEVKKYFGSGFEDYKYTLETQNHPIQYFVPNYYRDNKNDYDLKRLPSKIEKRPAPVVQNVSKKFVPSNGLFNRNIVVWPSHGWYYNNEENRWEWQRPRLFQSVEDKLTLSFVVPYLIPMLQNAGANVFDPRERDMQSNSVVVDNDSPSDIKSKYYIEKYTSNNDKWTTSKNPGFAVGNPPYPTDYNPFKKGTSRFIESSLDSTASVSWIPEIPETGSYAVYISYHASAGNASDAHYTVYHDGIQTKFKVNQQIGGNTWIYLGEFKFEKGYNPDEDKVVLTNQSKSSGKIISADAVRFGGGMGIIERGGRTSGRPKIFEAARYYLQYAGMPDTLVYDLNKSKNDYNDDYKSRPEYANYLNGAPDGPNGDRAAKGLGIPIDASLAIHTDAGITHSDTTVGTLAIYSTLDEKNKNDFPGGMSRMANRDFADLVQSQIVNDVRSEYDSTWNRRALEDSDYSEAVRPNIPSMLLEILSHQNYLDMKFAHDPEFRFTVARAIYKGILRFLSVQDNFKYIVEPLPVKCFTSILEQDGNVLLTWKPTPDSLEPTATPDKYIVYTRINSGGFDNGVVTSHPYFEFRNAKPGLIYSFKVTAVNNGGESFPSEILSVCRMDNDKKPVLIINGFYRVAGPAAVESSKFTGFVNAIDPGVPDHYDLSYTGSQYNFDSTSAWISNDEPGWGASHANYETDVIAGNTFNYPYIHGEAIKECGHSFMSVSAQAVEDSLVNLTPYKYIDLILGAQKSTPWERTSQDLKRGMRFKTFPAKLQKQITAYCNSGGNIFISGSYIASDLFNQAKPDSIDKSFATQILKYKLDADHASANGEVKSINDSFLPKSFTLKFNTELNDNLYAVTAPDAIQGVNGGKIILRYSENSFPAATAYSGSYNVIAFGFPFETILGQKVRDEVMKAVLEYLSR